jgi:hypothetical protein
MKRKERKKSRKRKNRSKKMNIRSSKKRIKGGCENDDIKIIVKYLPEHVKKELLRPIIKEILYLGKKDLTTFDVDIAVELSYPIINQILLEECFDEYNPPIQVKSDGDENSGKLPDPMDLMTKDTDTIMNEIELSKDLEEKVKPVVAATSLNKDIEMNKKLIKNEKLIKEKLREFISTKLTNPSNPCDSKKNDAKISEMTDKLYRKFIELFYTELKTVEKQNSAALDPDNLGESFDNLETPIISANDKLKQLSENSKELDFSGAMKSKITNEITAELGAK